jgi:hypothetical protein
MIADNFLGQLFWPTESDGASLAALCLVSRMIGAVATTRLYERVGWPAYATLQDHPALAAHVKLILIPKSLPEERCMTSQEVLARIQGAFPGHTPPRASDNAVRIAYLRQRRI